MHMHVVNTSSYDLVLIGWGRYFCRLCEGMSVAAVVTSAAKLLWYSHNVLSAACLCLSASATMPLHAKASLHLASDAAHSACQNASPRTLSSSILAISNCECAWESAALV